MITVLSRGSWKYSAASAVICEVARNSRLRQRLRPGASPRLRSIVDRKYDGSPRPSGCSRSGLADQRQQRRDVLPVHVAEPGRHERDPVVPVAERVDADPLVLGHVRHGHGLDRQDQHVPVQHVVVLDVGPQGQRRGLLAAVEEHRDARHPVHRGPAAVQRVDELLQRSLVLLAPEGDQFPPALPGGQHGEHEQPDEQRQPRPVDELGQVRGEEQQVDGEQPGRPGDDQPPSASATDRAAM